LIAAAAFCMYNRYVDGLGTPAPADPLGYAERAHHIVEFGYGGILTAPQSSTT
jgi:hypothetical protein